MVFNKELGITEEDVLKEMDILKLAEWQSSISSQRADIRNSVCSMKELSNKARKALDYMLVLEHMIKARIRAVKEIKRQENGYISPKERRKQRYLHDRFVAIAKKELETDIYNRIMEQAKQQIKEE